MRKPNLTRRKTAHLALPCIAVLCGCLLVAQCVTAETPNTISYALIVNAKNTTGGSRDEVKRLFLKQSGSWKSKLAAKPLDRSAKDPAHQAFLARVLKMNEARFIGHWLNMKQKTGATRPLAVSSDRALAKLVAKYPGAFGFLRLESEQESPEGTRVLFRF